MNIDIGQKIRTSRNEARITQEQAAELIGVSRQTISNWENNKSYPDIISVITMSDVYHVSLDYLLKGETDMTNYYTFLKDSTDVVKSNTRREKAILIAAYLIIWALAMIAFWFLGAAEDAMGYGLVYLWGILPVTTLAVSFFPGCHNLWGKAKWLAAPVLGLMYMLSEYCTFSVANNAAANTVNMPEFGMFVIGTVISLIGIAAGSAIGRATVTRNNKK